MKPDYNIPTILTLIRIALIPLLVVVFYLPWQYANLMCTIIFIIAAITDWLDGFLARKMALETSFGAFLDPVADKLMVCIVLVLIVQSYATIAIVIPAIIIIGREITITSLREWMAGIGKSSKVAVSNLGKWKTTTQMIAIGCLLYQNNVLGLSISAVGYALLYISAVLTLWSMISYLQAAFVSMVEDH